MKKAPEERAQTRKKARKLQWRKLINRQEDQHCGKLWEPRKQSRICSKHFLNGKPTEAYPYPTENLGYTSTLKQKKKRKTLENFRKLRQESTQIYFYDKSIYYFKISDVSSELHSLSSFLLYNIIHKNSYFYQGGYRDGIHTY